MKLFEVTHRFFVAAENEHDAEYINWQDGVDIEVHEATCAPPIWMDALPYGEDPIEKTVKEYLQK